MDPIEDFGWHIEERVDDSRVNLSACLQAILCGRVRNRPGGLVRPLCGHLVEPIRDRENPGAQRNLFSLQFL